LSIQISCELYSTGVKNNFNLLRVPAFPYSLVE
jgi:hypothetical protein